MEKKMDNHEFIRNIPKIELHLHIEGAIPIPGLWELVRKYDQKKNIKTEKELESKFVFKDFSHFLNNWVWKNTFIREYEDFSYFAGEVAKDLLKQNYKYVEFFFTPSDHIEKDIDPQKMLEALYAGVKDSLDKININFIFDIGRDYGPEKGLAILEQMKEMTGFNLVGMGMGGSEHLYPPEPFGTVFKKAKKYGFRTTVHAGEAAGAESIWNSIKYLKPDRIGHGTRMIEDISLVNYVKERQIHIELCPISNVRTGVIKNLAAHPVQKYYNNNLNISINTDDPKMFNTSLENEFVQLEKIGFSKQDFKIFLENGIKSAWCDERIKSNLKEKLNDYYKAGNQSLI